MLNNRHNHPCTTEMNLEDILWTWNGMNTAGTTWLNCSLMLRPGNTLNGWK